MATITEKALEEYLVENQTRFYRLAYSTLRSREDALDAVQTAVCTALEKRRTLREPSAVNTWFWRILTNVCTDQLRRKKRVICVPEEQLDTGGYDDPDPADSLDDQLCQLPTELQKEEWEQHDNQVVVTYEVKSQTDTTVSFVVQSAVSIANAWQEDYYYNLDIASGRELTLKDLLGEDWAAVCNASIQKQMAEAEDPSVYFSAGDGGFTTVDENTEFYINRDGNPVVVFPPYTVAPGALGSVEFEIRK